MLRQHTGLRFVSVFFFFLKMFQNYPEYVQKVTYLANDHEPILCQENTFDIHTY